MKLEKYQLYFSKTLLDYLKSKNLPHSKPSLIRYENEGIIQSPRTQVGSGKYSWRVYTGEEIEQIAEDLKNYLISKYE